MLEQLSSAIFWIALLKIIWVNILLSGDNAVVIALASRNLPPDQQKKAIFAGSAAAIVLRVVLTVFAAHLLEFPYLKLIGSGLLIWIGIQLMLGEEEDADSIKAHGSVWAAIRTILIADLVMSLDNVIAVAAAAESAPAELRTLLLVLGLGLSIPLIIFGSTLLLKLLEKAPALIVFGAALLGYVAGEMAISDSSIHDWFESVAVPFKEYIVELACAAFVVVVGWMLNKRRSHESTANAA
ncbi:TerC family protein [soil metagenome]